MGPVNFSGEKLTGEEKTVSGSELEGGKLSEVTEMEKAKLRGELDKRKMQGTRQNKAIFNIRRNLES